MQCKVYDKINNEIASGHKFCFIKIIVFLVQKNKDDDWEGARGMVDNRFHFIRFNLRFEDMFSY